MRRLTVSLLAGIAAISVSGAALAQDRAARQAELTRAAVQERAAQAFERMDVNGDGKIDAADREARVKARFDRIDANSDGAIDFAEYAAQRGSQGERAEGVHGERRAPKVERMGHRGMRGGGMGLRGPGRGADANSDGTITRAEFESALLTRFDAADADNDGTVTAAERKAQRDAMREQWRERRAQRAG
jgi:Ca2+-binding EF-hand superfamily protein